MTIYGVDVASYQGKPDWRRVQRSEIAFAFSKVTEDTNYTNPTWAHNRAGMLALGGGFLGGAYHFLHGGNGAAQARYFLAHAGDVSKLAVALDVEASGADAATSRAWVSEFKAKTGGHPVIGYYPRWYWEQTGRPDLSFFDTVWQSRYVNGSGSPSTLYGKVTRSYWDEFGREPISILQFSSSGRVPGIAGDCDVNAYKGSLDQLRALALGAKEDDVTPDDIKHIADAVADRVWKKDLIPAPVGSAVDKNPTWQPQSIVKDTNERTRAILGALAKVGSPNVDESAIVRGVLEGLAPATIAAAVVAALPPEMAKQVVDELKTRLGA